MISRCDANVATWSASGDSFVIKNVEQCEYLGLLTAVGNLSCSVEHMTIPMPLRCFALSSRTMYPISPSIQRLPINSLLDHPAPILQALEFLQLCPAAQLLRLPQAQVRPHLSGRCRRQDLDVRVLLPPQLQKGPPRLAPKHQACHQERTADQGRE